MVLFAQRSFPGEALSAPASPAVESSLPSRWGASLAACSISTGNCSVRSDSLFSLGFAFGGLDVNLLRCSTKYGLGIGQWTPVPKPRVLSAICTEVRMPRGSRGQMPARFSQRSPARPPSWTLPDLSAGGWVCFWGTLRPCGQSADQVLSRAAGTLWDWRQCPGPYSGRPCSISRRESPGTPPLPRRS